jgi:hypothetical protein
MPPQSWVSELPGTAILRGWRAGREAGLQSVRCDLRVAPSLLRALSRLKRWRRPANDDLAEQANESPLVNGLCRYAPANVNLDGVHGCAPFGGEGRRSIFSRYFYQTRRKRVEQAARGARARLHLARRGAVSGGNCVKRPKEASMAR